MSSLAVGKAVLSSLLLSILRRDLLNRFLDLFSAASTALLEAGCFAGEQPAMERTIASRVRDVGIVGLSLRSGYRWSSEWRRSFGELWAGLGR